MEALHTEEYTEKSIREKTTTVDNMEENKGRSEDGSDKSNG